MICRVINIPTKYRDNRVMTLKTYVDKSILFSSILFSPYLSVGYIGFMVCPHIDNLWITSESFGNPVFIGYCPGPVKGQPPPPKYGVRPGYLDNLREPVILNLWPVCLDFLLPVFCTTSLCVATTNKKPSTPLRTTKRIWKDLQDIEVNIV